MARLASEQDEILSEPTIEGLKQTPQQEPFPERSVTGQRVSVSVPIGADGKPDWSKLSKNRREKLRAILKDPETLKQFGLTESVGEVPIVVDPAFVHSALNFLGEFQAQIIHSKYKLSIEEARAIAYYTDPEKQMLTPPAQRVLSKRAPDFITKYGDEIILAVTLANIARLKFSLAAKRQETKERPVVPPVAAAGENGQGEDVAVQ